MTKSTCLILPMLLAFFGVRAQNATVSGKVESQVPRATVSLLRGKDSSVVKLAATDKEGLYRFEKVPLGNFLVSVTAVGFNKYHSTVFDVTADKTAINLPTVQLRADNKSLTGVTVTTKRPLVEIKVDRTVVNVEASITNVGANALEVLEKSPGINVDREGNISLKGKDGVLVMIDGRPTQLGGTDLANLLRNMNASQLDQIEIMTNPPAKYDAAGSGVINIKTKKITTMGYNGSVSLSYSQGRYPKINEGANFNYRNGKWNLYTVLNHGYRKNFEVMTIGRNIFNASNVVENHFDMTSDKITDGSAYSVRVGADYFAGKNTSVGFSVNKFSSRSSLHNQNRTNIFSPGKDLESVTDATVDNKGRWNNYSGNMNFRTVLQKGRELSADVEYSDYNSSNRMFMVNSYFDAGGVAVSTPDSLQGYLPQHIGIKGARVDYLHPLKKGRFEAGIKSSIVDTDNDVVYDTIQNGVTIRDRGRSNHFLYRENINAAYVNWSTSFSKKLSAQFGLRMENTNATGRQLTTGQNFDRHYTQLFPTAYLQHKINDKHNLGLNYGRRIRRPSYENLNPFIRFLDRYTYSEGNPNLKPQISNNVEFSHTYKNMITTTLNYSRNTDILQGVITQKGQEAYMQPRNIASSRQYGFSVFANNSFTKWWTNSFFVNVHNTRFEGLVNNVAIDFSATTVGIQATEQFKISKTLTAELRGQYNSPGVQGVIKVRSRTSFTAGFSQQLFKNMGSLRLTVRDIFYSEIARGSTKYGNVDAVFDERRDSRQVTLGFSYRFSKGKVQQVKKGNGSADEERNRVGVD